MSVNLCDFSVMPVIPAGMSLAPGADQQTRIKQVSKALEGVFVGQLMAEMGKGIDGQAEGGGSYQGFIQQAMTQQVTSGGGFGLAKYIEQYLDRVTPKTDSKAPSHGK